MPQTLAQKPRHLSGYIEDIHIELKLLFLFLQGSFTLSLQNMNLIETQNVATTQPFLSSVTVSFEKNLLGSREIKYMDHLK